MNKTSHLINLYKSTGFVEVHHKILINIRRQLAYIACVKKSFFFFFFFFFETTKSQLWKRVRQLHMKT